VSVVAALVAVAVGFGGVALGALLGRRNEHRSRSDALLVDALNDAVAAIAEAAVGTEGAQQRYASAVSRIGLHAPPEVVRAFRAFQDDATTLTQDGRDRLVAAFQVARQRLGHGEVSGLDLRVLLFGPDGPSAAVRTESLAGTSS
jgi:hypothetical protein